MGIRMFDIGLNLTSSQFAKDRDEVVARAFAAGVKGLLLTGTNLHESEQAQQLAQRYDAVGLPLACILTTAASGPRKAATPLQAGEDARSGGDRRMRSRFQP
jgi:Tat protein secretion system quality control protein TatD with DNase activity